MIATHYPVDNYQLVRIQINSAQPKYYFPDLPNLRRVRTYGINVYSAGVVPRDTNNVTMASVTDIIYGYLTLANKQNSQIFQQFEMSNLVSIAVNTGYANSGGYFPINGQIFDFAKSFVEWPSTYATGTAYPFTLQFGIFYSFL